MNLIEAYKSNREGKFRSESEGQIIDFSKYGCLIHFMRDIIYESMMLANDFEIVKGKKKVVIEDVRWERIDNFRVGIVPISGKNIFSDEDPQGLLKPLTMKMTLEWVK